MSPAVVHHSDRRLPASFGETLSDFEAELAEVARHKAAVRKKEEEALIHLAAIVNSSQDAIISKDLDGIVATWNPGAERLYGHTTEEMTGQSILRLVPPDRHAEAARILAALRNGENIQQHETQRLTKDGSIVHVSLTISPLRDSSGVLIGASEIARNITERIQAYAALRESEAAVRRATESASRAKDQFLAALSHELRTPLTPVLMLASAMEHTPDLPLQTREDCAMIRKNIELEARLIDDLLDLTRITQGKMVLRFENLDPHPLIEHSLEILRSDLRAKQLQVEADFCSPSPYISADGVRLQQVFWNILKNAVKFTPVGGQISILSYTEGRNWRVSITDTGLGITAEELPLIFTAFTQGKEAAEPRFGGVGLGLAISTHLVKEHRGRIWAESPGRGQGSTFHLELPLAPMTMSGRITLPPPAPKHRALRVLLVEDHEASRATLMRLLTLRGHTVTAAGSLAEARARASIELFDIVVSDLGLPDGSGHDLMRGLSREQGLCGIALSGYGMADDVKHSLEAGFNEHLTKPVDLATLERAMLRVWTKAHGV